jgi:hypothetical protein
MKLRILQAGRYNDQRHKAHKLAVGDELETGEAYGLSLVDAGLAEEVFELTAAVVVSQATAEAAAEQGEAFAQLLGRNMADVMDGELRALAPGETIAPDAVEPPVEHAAHHATGQPDDAPDMVAAISGDEPAETHPPAGGASKPAGNKPRIGRATKRAATKKAKAP